jgi:type VII secretion-associated serine protease mycosin
MHYRLCLLACLLLGMLAAIPAVPNVTPAAAAPAAAAEYVPGTVLLRLVPGVRLGADARAVAATPTTAAAVDSLNMLLTDLHATQADLLGQGSDTYHLRLDTARDAAELAALLDAHPAVVFGEPNYIRQSMQTPNDPFVVEQWALNNIQAFGAWDITTGSDVAIAVIDTGVASDHPDLQGQVLPGYNAISQSNRSEDDSGHGTAVSGLIAARTDNGQGVAGLCWDCSIIPVKALDSIGRGSDASLARGIRWAADSGARVINMSLGGTGDNRTLREAVEYANSRGVLLVAASGNARQRGNAVVYPAGYPEVLAVGGTGNTDNITGFSNTGDHVDIAAPSVGLWTTIIGEREYGPPNGTSFSSPYVAGAAGLVWSLRPDLAHTDVKCILEASADDKGDPGKDPEYGWGRLNVLRALQLTQEYSGCPLTPAPAAQPASPAAAFAPVPRIPTTADQVYFPQTQHTLRGTFKSYWEQHGGLPIFGYPISEEFIERGDDGRDYVVQYFQRHRFELHPENAPPYNVQLSRMGDLVLQSQGRSWFTFPKSAPTPGCLFFEATGQALCEPFLSAWSSSGLEFDGRPGKSYAESLALFGQPLSPPRAEEVAPGVTITVQWFERARFEDHGADGVLLGLLSSDLARSRGWR